jgi:UDP-GlcNAc:undecaprenyl-phosphate/decaprenyl-phosphate GlcNAc-1-phosphate transferase
VYSILFLALVSFLSCLALTPLVRVLSRAHGVLDHPDARKVHVLPIPRTGGVAIAAAYLCAVGVLLLSPLNGASAVNLPLMLKLLPAVSLVFAVGLMDDLFGLKAWHKLVIQVIASCLAYQAGVQVLGVAGISIHGYWSLLFTVVWLVGCSNAFNLIDGLDGLATGVGLFAAFTTLTAALLTGNAPLALATAPLVGALLAFLRYNFNPASIFLGDSGSLTIGFALGCFAAIWSQKSTTLLGMTAPLMALAVPLLDTGIAVVRRFIRRQPIFTPDRNHVHHRLLDRGLSPRKVALVMYGACGLAAAFSIVQTLPQNKFHGVLLLLFCAAAWVGIQMAGYAEFGVAKSLVMAGTFRDIVQAQMFVDGFKRRLTDAVMADDYWQVMRSVGRDLGVSHVRMSLAGNVYEDELQAKQQEPSSTLRIPLNDLGYVNFRIPSRLTVPHAIAITSVVEVLQRSLTSQWSIRAMANVVGPATRAPTSERLPVTPHVAIRDAILPRLTDSQALE